MSLVFIKGKGDEMGVSDSAQPLGSTMAGERWAGNAKGSLENAEGPSSQVKSRHEAWLLPNRGFYQP